MLLKSAVVVAFVVSLVSGLENNLDDTIPYFQQDSKVIKIYGDINQCNKTVCTSTCPEADHVLYCPEVVPDCLSGCACLLDCEHGLSNCFETKDCLAMRNLLPSTNRPDAS